jgi:hypothetical protein
MHVLLALLAGWIGASPAPSSPAPAQSVLSETQVLARIPLALLRKAAGELKTGANGAAGENRNGWKGAIYQRATATIAEYGVVAQSPQVLSVALGRAAYAFGHQRPDGSFGSIGRVPARSDAFFVADYAHTLLLLRSDPWFQTSPQTARLRAQAAGDVPRVAAAVAYLSAGAAGLAADRGADNRTFIYANALYLGGLLTGNSHAMQLGDRFAQDALSRQLPDGTFPELGGFDSSYQCVSLRNALVLWLYMAPADPVRQALWNGIVRGTARERAALLPSGEISTAGNTRKRHVDRRNVAKAFAYYAAITGDPQARRAAGAVLAYYYQVRVQ